MNIPHLHEIRANTFFVNAVYLMLSTFVVAATGFVFWVFVSHAHDVAAVGLATTLISISSLISLLGLFGFDTTFVRFLPRSIRKNTEINTGIIVVALASTLLAVVAAAVLPLLSPSLNILHEPWFFASFVFFTVVTSLNTLTNAIFLAYKRAQYILAINTIFSIFKMFLPLLFIDGGAATIFVAAGSAQLLGLGMSILWMQKRCHYKIAFALDIKTLRTVKKFSFSMYAASLLNLLPPTLLPLIIVTQMGPAYAAYYYMAFTIASVLYTVAYASTQSAFAEGSHDEKALTIHIKKAAKLIGILLVPAILLTVIASGALMQIFRHDYAVQAQPLLVIFACSALPVALYSGLGAIFKVTKNLRGAVVMNVVYAIVILLASYIYTPSYGIIAVGWAWAAGNIAACATGLFFILTTKKIKEL
jgi:O-antigen/teichoic acid export membrane protein